MLDAGGFFNRGERSAFLLFRPRYDTINHYVQGERTNGKRKLILCKYGPGGSHAYDIKGRTGDGAVSRSGSFCGLYKA